MDTFVFFLFICGATCTLLSGALKMVSDNRKNEAKEAAAKVTKDLDQKRRDAEDARIIAEDAAAKEIQRIDGLRHNEILEKTAARSQVDQLTTSIQAMAKKMEPFEDLAKKMYPRLKLEEALDRLRLDVLEQKKKTAEIEKKITPPTLSDEQRQRFIDFLRTAPKGKVSVYTHQGFDTGTVKYAGQIRSMVIAAGYDSGTMVGTLGMGPLWDGIRLTIEDSSAGPAHANQVLDALIAIGLKPEAGTCKDSFSTPSDVRIWVGPSH